MKCMPEPARVFCDF